MNEFAYGYDGSFSGFLSCVCHSREAGRTPEAFVTPETTELPMYPIFEIETQEREAKMLYQALGERCGVNAKRLLFRGFLSCHQKKDVQLFRFLDFAFSQGPSALTQMTHPAVDPVLRIARHVAGETEKYKGFVRFSELSGALVAEIAPKNRVLPLLRPHFCGRFGDCVFMVYDQTHKEALLYRPREWVIVPLEDFKMDRPDLREEEFRGLWRTFYQKVAIEARYNPRCRQTHMPKRYWGHMTEFMEPEGGPEKGSAVEKLPQGVGALPENRSQ